MDLTYFLEHYSEPQILAAGGLLVGIVFGACAQQSRFCLRAAALDFAHGVFGIRLSIWLLAFSSAVLATQVLVATGFAQVHEARQLAFPQSLSGAAIGGLMFGGRDGSGARMRKSVACVVRNWKLEGATVRFGVCSGGSGQFAGDFEAGTRMGRGMVDDSRYRWQ
ncbi:YeeE/YedE [Roseibium sp. TrichSKD4]|nr:YeeE/YedE [Roseibium sp. TrichSKD4]